MPTFVPFKDTFWSKTSGDAAHPIWEGPRVGVGGIRGALTVHAQSPGSPLGGGDFKWDAYHSDNGANWSAITLAPAATTHVGTGYHVDDKTLVLDTASQKRWLRICLVVGPTTTGPVVYVVEGHLQLVPEELSTPA